MSDLIINGIDHSAFDLDWAKRGGWCIVRGEVCKLISKATYISSDTDTLFVRAIAERMATREECAVAGIEYIEPPARWLPIESAPKDGTKVVLLTPTGDMLSPCEFVEDTAISETGAWLWWQVGPEWFTEVKNPTHHMILPKLPEETK